MDKDLQEQSALAEKSSTKISRRAALAAGAQVGLAGGLGAGLLSAPAVHAASKITLRYMHWEPELTIQAKWYRDVLGGFTKLHPGVVVENNFVTDVQYLTTLATMAAARTLPDIFHAHLLAAELGRAGLIVNYRDYFPSSFIAQFFPSLISQVTWDGNKLYALPLTALIYGIFVNNTLMSQLDLKPPQTWDDLIAMTPTIRTAGYTPLAWGNQLGTRGPDFFLPLVAQAGGDVSALDDLTQPGLSWNSKPVIDAFTLLQRLVEAHVLPVGINSLSQTQAEEMFHHGQAAMLFDGPWEPRNLAMIPKALAKSSSVVKLPAFVRGGRHWAGGGSHTGVAVNNHGPHRALALAFVRYLFSPAVYRTFIKNTRAFFPSMPSAKSVVTDPKLLTMIDYLPDATDHILFGAGSWGAVANAVQAVLNGSLTPKAAAVQVQASVLTTRAGA